MVSGHLKPLDPIISVNIKGRFVYQGKVQLNQLIVNAQTGHPTSLRGDELQAAWMAREVMTHNNFSKKQCRAELAPKRTFFRAAPYYKREDHASKSDLSEGTKPGAYTNEDAKFNVEFDIEFSQHIKNLKTLGVIDPNESDDEVDNSVFKKTL